MRFSHLLLISCASIALLSACGDPSALEKSNKNASMSGRQEVNIRLAHATEEAGDFASAENRFKQLVAQTPNSAQAHVELAQFYRRHHQDQKSLESFAAALALEPKNTDIQRDYANTYIGAGEPDKALTILNQAVSENKSNPLLYNSRGVALDQVGNYSEAQKSYKTAFDLDPSGGTTYKINISMSYILEGSYDKAIALLKPMLSEPEAPPIIRQNLALAYGMKGENESALKLGLQDLSTSEAEENVRFYRMLAHKHAGHSDKTVGAATVPASVVKDLFPEDEPAPVASVVSPPTPPHVSVPAEPKHIAVQAPVVVPVDISEEPEEQDQPGVPAPKPATKPLPLMNPSSGNNEAYKAPSLPEVVQPDESPLPEPTLKPDHF
jgi:Flp pilus assembly protein TadD